MTRLGEAEIDLGGIAKGYTLDLIYDYLITNKVDQYIINAGGSSILLGEKYENAGYFNLELSDIPGKRLKLKNCVVSTSGVSEQSTVIDGKRYSHIINPVTGSALAQYDSVRVVTDYGYLGDALSTSLMMNSIDEIKELEAEYDFMTLVVKDGKILYRNPNLKVY